MELWYVEAAIKALEDVREGLMEREFPKLKEVREEQEKLMRDRSLDGYTIWAKDDMGTNEWTRLKIIGENMHGQYENGVNK